MAICCTGIDYNHPALGGGFGAGKKVAKGYDLVGDFGVIPGEHLQAAFAIGFCIQSSAIFIRGCDGLRSVTGLVQNSRTRAPRTSTSFSQVMATGMLA